MFLLTFGPNQGVLDLGSMGTESALLVLSPNVARKVISEGSKMDPWRLQKQFFNAKSMLSHS